MRPALPTGIPSAGQCGHGTKDDESRIVPILDPLQRVLEAWKLKSGGTGLVCPPLRCDGEHVDKHTSRRALAPVLRGLGLARPGFGLPGKGKASLAHQKLWYWCTRHTFASQWAMAGRSLRELQAILGHSSIDITERYAHLVPGYFREGVYSAFSVDLSENSANLRQIRTEAPAAGPVSSPK